MHKARTAKLIEAMKTRQLVRFSSPFEPHVICGYVLDVGPKFFLLATVNDRIWLEGFECFRIKDVRKVRPDPSAPFVEAALKARRKAVPKKPKIDISGVAEILTSGGAAFSLTTIHCETQDPGCCWIGRVRGVRDGELWLQEINPDASWDAAPQTFRLKTITHVSFGQDYETALELVGGEPPMWPAAGDKG